MKNNLYLFQPQEVINTGDDKNYWLPYSAACVWSYVNQYDDISENYELKDIFFKRDDHDFILNTLENPFLVGFSCFIWNENYCLSLAEKIKKKWSNCFIVFGGEQSSKKHTNCSFIDYIVVSEGEKTFLEILREVLFKSNLIANNDFREPKLKEITRLDDLDIPSPYLDGTMDSIVKKNPNLKWATVVESNRGCPYSCTFCDWGGAVQSKVRKFDIEKIQKELDWIKKNNVIYLIFGDANFGIFRERDIEIVKMIKAIADESSLEAVNLQYAKNNTREIFEIGKILGQYNRGITVSVQSMNPDTLKAIKRKNLKVNDIHEVMKISEEFDVPTYTEVILGLPLETLETWKDGLTHLLELGQHQSIDFNLVEILENSEMSNQSYINEYGLKTRKLNQYYTLKTDDYSESGNVVYETSTMNLDDVVEGYMYAWLIVHFHINGYTQLLAKYARYMHNISYRTFYDEVFKKLNEDNGSKINSHYSYVRDNFKKYLETGSLDNWEEKGDSFHFVSHKYCYENRNEIFQLGETVLKAINLPSKEISILQTNLIYNLDERDQIKSIRSNIDIESWTEMDCFYEIKNKIKDLSLDSDYEKINFWFMRRKNLLKNKLVKCDLV